MSETRAPQKQLNFGLTDAVIVQQLNTQIEKFRSDLMNDGYGPLNKKQFMVDFTEVVGPTVRKWIKTGLSGGDSAREAKREKARERIQKHMAEDINAKVKNLMVEIIKIIEPQIDKVLEEYYGPPPPQS